MRKVKLKNSDSFAKVGADDFEQVCQYQWNLNRGYATKTVYSRGKLETLRMHRLVMKAAKGIEIDHINGDKLDNRKSNLRVVSRHQNSRNRSGWSNSSSKYKGVIWNEASNKWQARIYADGKSRHLGYFSDEKEAAHNYNRAAEYYHGEFAKKNHIED